MPDRGVGDQHQALAGTVVNNDQDAHAAAVDELIGILEIASKSIHPHVLKKCPKMLVVLTLQSIYGILYGINETISVSRCGWRTWMQAAVCRITWKRLSEICGSPSSKIRIFARSAS
jgi:hypothetical protein